ncbi:MAG: hypothetical protein MUD03_04465, partial [Pirellula sp.]|nr:hypothetical protein [Pirellula sp.]
RFRNEDGVFDTFVRLQSLHLPSELEEIVEGESNRPQQPPKRGSKETPEEPAPPNPPESAPSKEDADKPVDALAHLYEEKKGYSNYYFNKLELDRIFQLQKVHTQFTEADQTAGLWKWQGEFPAENQAWSGEWSDSSLTMKIGEQTETLPAVQGWQQTVKKQSPMSLAIALRVWQQWHAKGPRLVGEAIYLGRNPVVGERDLMDTTKLTIGEVTCLVYTDPEDGQFRLVEIFPDTISDPAEVYFEKADYNNRLRFPTVLRLQFGLETKLIAQIKSHQFSNPTKEEGL